MMNYLGIACMRTYIYEENTKEEREKKIIF
jgi:hypothetical protein